MTEHWIDLHVHTTASDGQLTPSQVVRQARSLGLAAIAITDHDTIDGVAEAIDEARGSELQVISGVEMSTDTTEAEVHVLGYLVDYGDAKLRDRLAVFRESRVCRAQGMVAKLQKMGLPLDWERVQAIAGDASVGRPHVARALLERGYVSTIDEAFRLYIGRSCPAYVDRYKLSPADAVELTLEAGGVPVLAHPLRVSHLIPSLARNGLAGVEAHYTGYALEDINYLTQLADKYGLVVTGGSDFHGEDGWPDNLLGGPRVPLSALDTLRERRARLHQQRSHSDTRTVTDMP